MKRDYPSGHECQVASEGYCNVLARDQHLEISLVKLISWHKMSTGLSVLSKYTISDTLAANREFAESIPPELSVL